MQGDSGKVTFRVPGATYRLQFNQDFGFADARRLVPYLLMLGITDLYASPIFQVRRGSTHGYDVTDPTRLNPELGTREEFDLLSEELRRHGMGLLLDIEPNHMAASPENPWWTDVLENGPSSRYASYFDIDWHPDSGPLADKVLLPLLGGPYGQVLEKQELVLGLDEGGFHVRYYNVKLPIQLKSYRSILAHRMHTMEETLGMAHLAFRALVDLLDAIQRLPVGTVGDRVTGETERERERIKHRLWHLYLTYPEIKTFLDENVRIFNGERGSPHSFDLLDQLLAQQAYRLGFWRTARECMNYRRFFDISDLVSVRVEDMQVFKATHRLIFELVKDRKVTGLRTDHIDGLYDPPGYLHRLQGRLAPEASEQGASPSFYVLVEKILIGDETLPKDWPVCGTTGYEFAIRVNGVSVDPVGIKPLDAYYTRFTGSRMGFPDIVYRQKKWIMEALFPGEMRTLGHSLSRLAGQDRHARDLPRQTLLQGLVEVTACLPVYRTYIRGHEVPPQDRTVITRAAEEAMRRNAALGTPVFDFLRRVFLLDFPPSLAAEQREAWLCFVRRWQQFTGPIMAKGLEDTSLYTYNRLISLNEVGGDPGAQHVSVKDFHRHNRATRADWPYTLNATSTHDTKRSEDVRARINVLSELPQVWAQCVTRWNRWNRANKRKVNGRSVPDLNEEMLLYQTLVGAWPFRADEVPAFKKRLEAFMIKAAREAKVYTSWIDSDPAHERALVAFVQSILRTSRQNRFLLDFVQFQKRIAFHGALNAVAQVLLKITSPGVPDFYQGTGLWDFSLVDPDNRRPVDFTKRIRLLEDLKRREAEGLVPLVSELLLRWDDGRIKLFVTARALDFRREHRALFLEGDYLPLYALGNKKEHVCSFARRNAGAWALVVVPRLIARLVGNGKPPLGRRVWGNGCLVVPREAPARWQNILTGETLHVSSSSGRKALPLHRLFQHFPLALISGTMSDVAPGH
ncbi:MAG: malto-oligosyltrehalose synthase [Candidatus Methylomirabilales bacterium]